MSNFKIIGIDPGKNLGVSILTIDSCSLSLLNIETRIYYLDTNIYTQFSMFNKLEYLNKIILSLLVEFNPVIVGMEQVFKHRFANAVIQLSQYTSAIEYGVRSFNPYIFFLTYPPKVVKKIIGATGDADKNKMLDTLKSIPAISKYLRENITEHEVDAIAIGYISYQKFLFNPEVLLMSQSNFNCY